MDATAPSQILKHIEAISAAITRASQDLNSIQSPTTEYERNWAAIQTKLDNAWERGLRCGSLAERSEVQKELVTLAHTQEALKAEHEADLESANSSYETRLRGVLPRFCEELVRVLAPSLLENALRDLATDEYRGRSPGDLEDASPEDKRLGQGVKRKQRRPEGGRQKRQRQTDGYKPRSRHRQRRPSVTSVASLSRRHTRQHDGSPRRETLDAITPGEVYLAYWGRSKALLAVLLLPTKGLDKVGVHNETIETLGLLRELPSCYDYDPSSGILNWRQGYRDGEALVPDREYPVMYFDGKAFPTRSKVGWVAAKDLLDFDLKAIGRTIPNYKHVRKYLETRDRGRPQRPNTVSRTNAAGGTAGNSSSNAEPESPVGEHASSDCPQDQHHSPTIAAALTAKIHDFPSRETHQRAQSRAPSVPASDLQESLQGTMAGTLETPVHERHSSAGEDLFHEACITVRTPQPRTEVDTAPQVRPIFDEQVPGAHDEWDSSLADLTMVAAEAECFLCQQEAAKQVVLVVVVVYFPSSGREAAQVPMGHRTC
ncbi:hypothetical protein Purlil1_14178 [Purpureocillium lilacinum]|uniref:Uncharacterized protein n=1 Tax=Purpureocillium lilacinum TaxID=33203 RepID=A0ABR0BC02_PURLI|nr:hypothetical protein Purlil1_14178 [Purpureocillium lilacinum]